MAEVRSLYRSFLREARRFPDYNIREYIKRRSAVGFRESPSDVSKAIEFAKDQLALVKRQSVVYSLYVPRVKNVMELKFES